MSIIKCLLPLFLTFRVVTSRSGVTFNPSPLGTRHWKVVWLMLCSAVVIFIPMGTFGTISGGRDNRSYRLLLIFQICATTPSGLDVKSQLICTFFSPSVRFIIPLFMVGIVRQKPENYYITLYIILTMSC